MFKKLLFPSLMVAAFTGIALFRIKSRAEALSKQTTSLQKIADEYVISKKGVGVIIGVISPHGTVIVSAGETKLGNHAKPSASTVYQIGSITKSFTGLLLAHEINQGQVRTTDTVASKLKSLKFPFQDVTVGNIASHSSGLTGIDAVYTKKITDPMDPWANFSSEELQALLLRTKLAFKPGTGNEYSNIGAAVAGQMIADIADVPFATLLQKWIFDEVGMTQSTYDNPDERKDLAQGYMNDKGKLLEAKPWHANAISPAGAILSTMTDMLKYAEALLDGDSVLHKDFVVATKVQDSHSIPVGLFWMVIPEQNFAFHNGGTYGMNSFLSIDSKNKTAVVVLANTSDDNETITEMGIKVARSVH